MKQNNKAQLAIFFSIIGVLFLGLISYGLFASVAVRTNVDLIKASELIINKSQPDIDLINFTLNFIETE